GARAAAAPAHGPDPRLVDDARDRLAESGVGPDDAVVVAAAGSSRPEAGEDVEEFVAALRRRRRGPVVVGYGAMARPTVAEAVATARTGRPRVAVLSYLLAPGFFYDRVRAAGGDVVTRPLGPDPRIADVVLDRYDREVTRLRARPARLPA
ncbi:MAG: sirohydrochlorin chelatase, partial [Actinomycetaceae bacterium]